jgi:hypothetical protein
MTYRAPPPPVAPKPKTILPAPAPSAPANYVSTYVATTQLTAPKAKVTTTAPTYGRPKY